MSHCYCSEVSKHQVTLATERKKWGLEIKVSLCLILALICKRGKIFLIIFCKMLGTFITTAFRDVTWLITPKSALRVSPRSDHWAWQLWKGSYGVACKLEQWHGFRMGVLAPWAGDTHSTLTPDICTWKVPCCFWCSAVSTRVSWDIRNSSRIRQETVTD